MKKIFALLALSAAATSAMAAGPTVGISYDGDYGSETKVFVAQATAIGSFDAGLLATRYNKYGSFVDTSKYGKDNANGFDVGYTTPAYDVYGPIGLTGRVGYGRLNNIDQNGGGFVGNTSYFSVGTEASTPITDSLNGFINYRHRNPFSTGPIQNRAQIGVDYAVDKNISARLGVSYARQADHSGVGAATSLEYTF